MSDEHETPGQQEIPGEQERVQDEGQKIDWEARYKGSVAKIQALTEQLREANAQQESKSSEIEQLKAQLNIKDTEKDVAVSERDKKLEAILQENTELAAAKAKLEALQLKVEIAKELKKPELIEIAHHLPDMTDKEALTTVMKDFASFTDSAVREREEQLRAGITEGADGIKVGDTAPTTSDAWLQKINAEPLGSAERNKLMEDYGIWLERAHAT